MLKFKRTALAVVKDPAGSVSRLTRVVSRRFQSAPPASVPPGPNPASPESIPWPVEGDFYSRRNFLAEVYLSGEGIEIGALHTPLKVPGRVTVKYVDRSGVEGLKQHYPELGEVNFVEPDILDDGEKLGTLAPASQDFIIANHFLEHCQDPIDTLGNMLRVLKSGGILFLTIPDKRYGADFNRPVTSLEHLLKDHTEGPESSRRGHFEEWVRLWPYEGLSEEVAVQERVDHLIATDYSIHYHVWTPFELFEFFTTLKKSFGYGFDIELYLKNQGEMIFIIRKD